MLEVQVYNIQGEAVEKLQVDEAAFGGEVNVALLKQAVVAYHTNSHAGSSATRGRGEVVGSTRKIYRQKGTGNARHGPVRSNIMRGGGVAFGKDSRQVRHRLSKMSRRRALQSAILAKLLGADLLVVDELKLDQPKTKTVAALLGRLHLDRGCLLALAERNDVIYRSARNLPRVDVRIVAELNSYDVTRRQKMLLTRDAMNCLLQG
ncbi:MAG: 50S ribosomal protein L4 [Planctomycetes bacterium]|nr:50S ribosomal protein L4 [Planctomycetota bacterium]